MSKTLSPKEDRALGLKLSKLHYQDRERFCCRSSLSQSQKKRVCGAVEGFYSHWNNLPQSQRDDLAKKEKLTRDDEINIGFLESESSLTQFLNAVKMSKAMRMSPTNRSPDVRAAANSSTPSSGRTSPLRKSPSRTSSPSRAAAGPSSASGSRSPSPQRSKSPLARGSSWKEKTKDNRLESQLASSGGATASRGRTAQRNTGMPFTSAQKAATSTA
mmetsp:Transcript_27402/g.63669  ORF Transcript_27402/g.63669 Transcript_27402/m.63669 type:complete len:216 (+) Transcript_27402:434-1081(+)